jgi:hypothetical protein
MSWRPPPAPLWRVDVPAPPPHITCLKGAYEEIYVLVDGGWWARWRNGVPISSRPFEAILESVPLVEHPDPRKATT